MWKHTGTCWGTCTHFSYSRANYINVSIKTKVEATVHNFANHTAYSVSIDGVASSTVIVNNKADSVIPFMTVHLSDLRAHGWSD